MDTGQGIAVAGAIMAFVWAAVQFGDRLWGKRQPGFVEQSRECRFEHASITESLRGMHEAQRDLLRAHADLLRVVTETNTMTRAEVEVAKQRHREVIEALSRIERVVRSEGTVRT